MKRYDALLGKNNETLISSIQTDTIGRFLEYNKTYDQVCQDCIHEDCLQLYLNKKDNRFDFYDNHPISYRINNYGFRSDNFTPNNVKDNFAYFGCSNTFGLGVPLDHVWAHQLNKSLNGDRFINVGTRGGNIETITYNFFKFIEIFGNPKGVFLYIPNLTRQLKIVGINKEKHISMTYENSPASVDELIFRSAMLIKSIEVYCTFAKIPLVYSSWDPRMSDEIQKLVDNDILNKKYFVNRLDKKMFLEVAKIEDPKELSKSKYWDESRDGHIPGSDHWMTYQIFKAKFKNTYGL
jgi:hypothetical protein